MMKEEELRSHADCSFCGNKIGASGMPIFYTVKLTQWGLDYDACQRQQGLGMMIGAPLAMVMGTDADLANKISVSETTICFTCQDKILEFMRDE